MYPKKRFFTDLVWNTNNKSHLSNKSSHKEVLEQVEMFVDLLSVPTPSIIKQPSSSTILPRSQPSKSYTSANFFFSWSSTFLLYEIAPTINEVRVQVTTNYVGKKHYSSLFDCIDIVLDKCSNNNKIIQGSLTTHGNIYKTTSALFFSFFKLKASLEGSKIKKWGKEWGVEDVQSPWTTFFSESSLLG